VEVAADEFGAFGQAAEAAGSQIGCDADHTF
jgi:hypothetical protein